jgi:hypothetical protein
MASLPAPAVAPREDAMTSQMSRAVRTLFVLCLVGMLGAWGCDQAGGPMPAPAGPSAGTAAASAGASTAGGQNPAPSPGPNRPPVEVDPDLFAILDEALQDEHHAFFTYTRVLEDLGKVKPFTNIVNAENQHVKAAAKLFEKRGWNPPASAWTLDNVPAFTTLAEACAGGVIAEQENIAMYDQLLSGTLPEDVAKVFGTLRAASLENHLPAFQTCVEKAK